MEGVPQTDISQEKDRKIKRVLSDSPEFVKSLDRQNEIFGGRTEFAFGELSLRLISATRSLAEFYNENPPDLINPEITLNYKNKIAEINEGIRWQLAGLIQTNPLAVDRSMARIATDPDLAADLEPYRKYILNTPGLTIDPWPITLASLVVVGVIPDDICEKIFASHVKSFHEQAGIFAEKLPEMLDKFCTEAEQAIDAGGLPITKDRLRRCIEETSIEIADPLSQNETCSTGGYAPELKVVSISADANPADWYHILVHEFMHALSGQSFLYVEDAGKEAFQKIHAQRVGLRFLDVSKKERRFMWLNEAVTEAVATDITKVDLEGVYPVEKENLQHLINLGVPRELLIRAYFEEYDSDAADRVPAWKELVAKINELLPRGIQDLIQTDIDIEDARANHIKKMIEMANVQS